MVAISWPTTPSGGRGAVAHSTNRRTIVRPCIGFRFDVDTHVCARTGVPNLLRLADRLGVQFTFFFNMGRAVLHRAMLSSIATRRGPREPSGAKLSSLTKLGAWHYAVAAIVNPAVGRKAGDVIRAALAAGHEIGLHGGRNHGDWQRNASHWSQDRLRREIRIGLDWLTGCGATAIDAFSSPGWRSPAALPAVLEDFGIELLADEHGHEARDVRRLGPNRRVLSVPTNILGEPGGVGYVEHTRALGMDTAGTVDDFLRHLERLPRFAVVYDHPFYAGVHALDTVERMIAVARERGFRFAGLGAIGRQHGYESQDRASQ